MSQTEKYIPKKFTAPNWCKEVCQNCGNDVANGNQAISGQAQFTSQCSEKICLCERPQGNVDGTTSNR